MKRDNKKVGGVGERAAVEFLTSKGYELISSNYSTRLGEIDLIMLDKGVLVFVEVKTKTGDMFGRPEEMFGRRKYHQVKRVATMYLAGKQVPCRIDMVAVEMQAGKVTAVRHYENVVC